MTVPNLAAIRREIKEARRQYVDMYVRSRIEEMSPDISDVDWDTWKRQARKAWDHDFTNLAALLTQKDGQ